MSKHQVTSLTNGNFRKKTADDKNSIRDILTRPTWLS